MNIKRFAGLALVLILSAVCLLGCSQPLVTPTGPSSIDPVYEAANVNNSWTNPGYVNMSFVGTRLGIDNDVCGYAIRIHNGEENDANYFITIQAPSGCNPGYEPLPVEFYGWVNISNSYPLVAAKETRVVWIGFDIPAGPGDSPWIGKKYEIRTQYKQDQQAMVGLATATRWQLDLRK